MRMNTSEFNVDKAKIIIWSSPSPRVLWTTKSILEQLEGNLSESDIYMEWKLSYRPQDWGLSILYTQYFEYFKDKTKTETDFIRDFLSGNLSVKPLEFAKPYLKFIKNYFNKVESSGKTYKVISFRHWEKYKEYENQDPFFHPLSETWKNQAKELWKIIKDWLWESNIDNIRVLWTHNIINEGICVALFWYDTLKASWREWLDFAEEIEYVFKKKGWIPVLEVTRAWETKSITKEQFEEKFCNFIK